MNVKTLCMKKEKLYFSEIDEEMAYVKSYLIDEMKDRGLTEIKVWEAIRELKTDYYFCKAIGAIGVRGKEYEPCGKECEVYEPRNGKSGCCEHRGFCYEPGKKFILKVNGKLLLLPDSLCISNSTCKLGRFPKDCSIFLYTSGKDCKLCGHCC